jgi:large subunit ribosomal protein L17
MRHQVFGKKLNRDIKERKALYRSLIEGLILHERIKTTMPKAKAVRDIADKLVTKAKNGSNASKSLLESFLCKKAVIAKLVTDIAPRFKEKSGGYIRIVKLGKRTGDFADMVNLEWSVQPEIKKVEKGKTEKKDKKINKK